MENNPENSITNEENNNLSDWQLKQKIPVWTNFWYWFWFLLVAINIIGLVLAYAMPNIAQSMAGTQNETLRFIITVFLSNIMFTLKGSVASLIVFAYIFNKLMFYSVANDFNETRTLQQAVYIPEYDSLKYEVKYSKKYNQVSYLDVLKYFILYKSGIIYSFLSLIVTLIVTSAGLFYLFNILTGSASSIADIFLLSVVIYEAWSITKYCFSMAKLRISLS